MKNVERYARMYNLYIRSTLPTSAKKKNLKIFTDKLHDDVICSQLFDRP